MTATLAVEAPVEAAQDDDDTLHHTEATEAEIAAWLLGEPAARVPFLCGLEAVEGSAYVLDSTARATCADCDRIATERGLS